MLLNLCHIVFHINDAIDILLVALLLYVLYNLLKGTAAINIFFGIFAVVVLWRIVLLLNMRMLSAILNAFISVGFIALIVVFQPEIRAFLLVLGKPLSEGKNRGRRFLFWISDKDLIKYDYNLLLDIAFNFAENKTGAIIILTRKNNLEEIVNTGEILNAKMSYRLLGNLFFKNSPLHDGAVVISNDKIVSAGCILPVSNNTSLPLEFGLRHRAAIGITENTDALAIVISEERGSVSIAVGGKVYNSVTKKEFTDIVNNYFPKAIDSPKVIDSE